MILTIVLARIQGLISKETINGIYTCERVQQRPHSSWAFGCQTVQPEEGRRPAFADMTQAHLQRLLQHCCSGLQVTKALRLRTFLDHLIGSALVYAYDGTLQSS